MTEQEIIRKAIELRGITQTILAEKVGLKRQSNISSLLSHKSLSVANLVKLLDAMDFDVVIKDRNGSKRENVWKIEKETEGKAE